MLRSVLLIRVSFKNSYESVFLYESVSKILLRSVPCSGALRSSALSEISDNYKNRWNLHFDFFLRMIINRITLELALKHFASVPRTLSKILFLLIGMLLTHDE